MIAIDTETYLLRPGLLTPRMVCLSAHDGKETTLLLAKDAKPLFLRALQEGCVGANIAYDLGVAAAYWPDVLPAIFEALDGDRVYDVQLLEALYQNTTPFFYLDPETGAPLKEGYSLAYLEKLHLGRDRSEEKHGGWRLRYAELDGVPVADWPPEASKYAKDDAEGTYRVFEKQRGRPNFECIHDEVRAAFALHLTSAWGVRTDPLYVRKVSHDIRQLHDSSRKRFLEAGLVKVRKATKKERDEGRVDFETDGIKYRYATDTKALCARVEQAYQGRPPRTPTGQVERSEDALIQSGNPLLEAFGEAGPNEKFFGTYLRFIEEGTKGPVNARYRSLLKTGRTSCGRKKKKGDPTDFDTPNLQNLPRKGPIREAHVPRPGWVHASVDFGTQESVCLAQVQLNWFGHSALADAINSGQDIHIRTGANLTGTTYDELLARYKTKDPAAKALRQASKPATFGLPGLLGPPGLVLNARTQYGVRFCEYVDGTAEGDCYKHERTTTYGKRTISPTCVRCLEIAINIRQAWLREFPEMQPTLDICVRMFEDGEPMPLGGNGMLVLATDKPGTYCNGIFQALAASASKRALYEVVRASYAEEKSVLYGNCRPVIFLHDEIFAELREEVASECADEIVRIMETSMHERYTPGVRVRAEPALMRRWFKGAEPVRSKSGKLLPWWPADKDGNLTWDWEPDRVQMALDTEMRNS